MDSSQSNPKEGFPPVPAPRGPLLDVTVVIADEADYDIAVSLAEEAGMLGIQRVDLLGLAYGVVEEARLEALKAVPGIREVRMAERAVAPVRGGVRAWAGRLLRV